MATYSSPVAAAVVVVAVAVAAAVAVAVAADAVAALAGSAAAAPLGADAAGAKRGHPPRVSDTKIMAGFDTVDPAYACVVSFAAHMPCWRVAITPNSRRNKRRPQAWG